MAGIAYRGTVAGFKEFAQRELLKAGFMGQSIAKDAGRIQHRLNKAAAQDRTKRVLTTFQRGGGVA